MQHYLKYPNNPLANISSVVSTSPFSFKLLLCLNFKIDDKIFSNDYIVSVHSLIFV